MFVLHFVGQHNIKVRRFWFIGLVAFGGVGVLLSSLWGLLWL